MTAARPVELGFRHAVTTRSHLRSRRLFAPMLVASLRVRRQLKGVPGCVRFASIVAGSREFWTITLWRNQHAMLEFMRSGAHEDVMWFSGRWLDSFWLTRWRPAAATIGHWDGLRTTTVVTGDPSATSPPPPALRAALDALPHLREAVDSQGMARYETSPYVRRRRDQLAGAAAVTIRVAARPWHIPLLLLTARRLRRMLGSSGCLRSAVGFSRPDHLYALAVFGGLAAASRLAESPDLRWLLRRWRDRLWIQVWQAENEFGHWDGLRLRTRRQTAQRR